MRNLSNLGLVEMTEQEMREVNGGLAWYWWALVAIGSMIGLKGDSRASEFHPEACRCGSGCPCCCICEDAWY